MNPLPPQLQGHNFTLKAAVTKVHMDREWHCIGYPNCDQSLIKAGDAWFCSMHGNLSIPTEIYRITATIFDDTGSIPALIFNEPSANLARMTCPDMLTTHNPDNTMCKIINKQALFRIQAHKNNRAGMLRCTVNKVDILTGSTTTAITPAPATPSPSSSTKRPLFHELSLPTGKKPKDN